MALTETNELAFAFQGKPKAQNLKCPTCRAEVFFRSEHKRRLSGDCVNVRAHFVHHGSGHGCPTGEAQIHLYGKEIVCALLSHIDLVLPVCVLCHQGIIIEIIPPHHDYAIVCEHLVGPFRIDVAVLVGGRPHCCIEIFNTSRVSTDKTAYLDLQGIPWVEVSAHALVQAFETQSCQRIVVPVLACSHHGLCSACKKATPFRSQKQALAAMPWFGSLVGLLAAQMHRPQVQSDPQLLIGLDSAQTSILEYMTGRLAETRALHAAATELATLNAELAMLATKPSAWTGTCGELVAAVKAARRAFEQEEELARLLASTEELRAANRAQLDGRTPDEVAEQHEQLVQERTTQESLMWEQRNASCENKLSIPFGKHKNHCVEAVWEHDPGYVVWLAGYRPHLEGSKPLKHSNSACFPNDVRKLACDMIRGSCYRCHENLGRCEAWKTFCANCFWELKNQ